MTKRFLSLVDISYMTEAQTLEAYTMIVQSMIFLGFFDPNQKVQPKCPKTGNSRNYLQVFGDVMADKLSMDDNDRDLVFMRHVFEITDPKTSEKWNHYSTMVGSGSSKAQGGYTFMAKTVGLPCAISTRLVLEGKIKRFGVLSPITKDIYEPIMEELEKNGVGMVEESTRQMKPKL